MFANLTSLHFLSTLLLGTGVQRLEAAIFQLPMDVMLGATEDELSIQEVLLQELMAFDLQRRHGSRTLLPLHQHPFEESQEYTKEVCARALGVVHRTLAPVSYTHLTLPTSNSV